MTLEKDPQQEDFLQGRMPGNPYSSNEPGIGPLMRDIKNKICQDCDLVALLEDDSGMEVRSIGPRCMVKSMGGDPVEVSPLGSWLTLGKWFVSASSPVNGD